MSLFIFTEGVSHGCRNRTDGPSASKECCGSSRGVTLHRTRDYCLPPSCPLSTSSVPAFPPFRPPLRRCALCLYRKLCVTLPNLLSAADHSIFARRFPRSCNGGSPKPPYGLPDAPEQLHEPPTAAATAAAVRNGLSATPGAHESRSADTRCDEPGGPTDVATDPEQASGHGWGRRHGASTAKPTGAYMCMYSVLWALSQGRRVSIAVP